MQRPAPYRFIVQGINADGTIGYLYEPTGFWMRDTDLASIYSTKEAAEAAMAAAPMQRIDSASVVAVTVAISLVGTLKRPEIQVTDLVFGNGGAQRRFAEHTIA